MGLGVAGTIAAVGTAATVAGTAASLAKGSGQSGAISTGQRQANALLQPYTNQGTAANAQEANLLGLNGQDAANSAMSTFQSSPGYQFSLQQGERAVDAGAAAQGMTRSGATMKAEDSYATGLANQTYQSYISNLNSLSNLGITAGGGEASVDTGAASNQASIYGNAATGVSNSIGGGLTNLGSTSGGLSSLFSSGSSSNADGLAYAAQQNATPGQYGPAY